MRWSTRPRTKLLACDRLSGTELGYPLVGEGDIIVLGGRWYPVTNGAHIMMATRGVAIMQMS
jgi:hypothetical protein